MTILLEVTGSVLLFALVFGMSATVDTSAMQHQVRNRNAIGLGLFCQFLLLPWLGYVMVDMFNLDYPMGITLLVVMSSPGGSYSNWWCSLFNADLALSVTMTAISTILSVFALPANLILYSHIAYDANVTEQLDWQSVFIALTIVIAAIGMGLFCSNRSHSLRFNILANKIGNVAGFFLIIFSATVTNTGDADSKIWARHWTFYASCALPCFLGLFLASLLATFLNLERPERMAVSIECCYQNVGIATTMALAMFKGNDLNDAMGIPFFYGVCEAVMVGIYCVGCWKAGWSKAPADASFWMALTTTYEVVAAHPGEMGIATTNDDPKMKQEGEEGNYVQLTDVSSAEKSSSPENTPAWSSVQGEGSSNPENTV